jgi:ferrous iron transport protein B
VPTAARFGEGLPNLLAAIRDVATGQTLCRPRRFKNRSTVSEQAVQQLVEQVEALFPALPNARWVAMRLLDGDQRMIEAVRRGELGALNQPAPGQGDHELRAQPEVQR